MKLNMRRQPRGSTKRQYAISWQDEQGMTHAVQAQSVDASEAGIAIRCAVQIPKDTIVYIQAEDGCPSGYTCVRHTIQRGDFFIVGLELDEATTKSRLGIDPGGVTDFYEFLQISPKAQAETIQRVYRFLAARYHPDNPETSDLEKFLLLNRAYETLSTPESRARYDESLKKSADKPNALFESVDFLDGVEGELNRRLAVLSLLYRKCRANIHSPQVSLLELEAHMGFPREYLDFTIWYLRSKKYIKQEDNAELALTSAGVDFIEENYVKLPLLRRLLDAGVSHPARSHDDVEKTEPEGEPKLGILGPGKTSYEGILE